jgi:subtilase family serine protease
MSLRPLRHGRMASLAAVCATVVALASCSLGSATTSQSSTPTGTGGDCQPQSATQGFTPQQIRDAYGVTPLLQAGHTGKGQTVVLIESFGDPTLQQDVDTFDRQFCLPPITVKVMAPLGTTPFNPSNKDMPGWAGETALDVEIVHSIAPDANIVVMTSPVDETEGTIGLPQFYQLEQQAIQQHLGNVISQSWGVSEVTLTDQAGQQEIARWDAMYKAATTQQGITFTTGSGDNGATDFKDLQATVLSSAPTTSFPSDEQWVTSVGGTQLQNTGAGYGEIAWSDSGGGFSQFYPTPTFQQGLPSSVESELAQRRGVPDVSANGDPASGWQIRVMGQWQTIGGTSAGAPFWAALVAIADQMAGHPIGNINPALYHIGESGAYAQDFRDVTSGNNSVNTGGVQVQGYDAVPGWDPITGLGSPIANKLLPDLVAATQGATP